MRDTIDRVAVADVMHRYMRGIDRRDFDLVAACFTPDAHADFSAFQGPIREVIQNIRDGVAGYGNSMHFIGNQYIEIDGDAAHMETYAMNQHLEPVEAGL